MTPPRMTGADALARLAMWQMLTGMSAPRLAARCTPPVHRSTLTRWRGGMVPQHRVWQRFADAMQRIDAAAAIAVLS